MGLVLHASLGLAVLHGVHALAIAAELGLVLVLAGVHDAAALIPGLGVGHFRLLALAAQLHA
eukprot:9082805-Alexandrium_andersonii.AAC.1